MPIEIVTKQGGISIVSPPPTQIVTRVEPTEVIAEVPTGTVLNAPANVPVIDSKTPINLLSTGVRFIQTIKEDDMAFAKRTDFVGEDVIYKGEAAPGSLGSDPVWRIRKVVIAGDGDVSEKWAALGAFSQVWDNRLALEYV